MQRGEFDRNETWLLPGDRPRALPREPWQVTVNDSLGVGPAGFGRVLRAPFRGANCFVVWCGGDEGEVEVAVYRAVILARSNVVVVEAPPSMLATWLDLIRGERPAAPVVVVR